MAGSAQPGEALCLDERNHVERPLLDQLAGLDWEVIDLTDMKQTPADTSRVTLINEYCDGRTQTAR